MELTIDGLKTLIRIIRPLQALQEELEELLHLEIYQGRTSDLAVRSFQAQLDKVRGILDDPYLEALVIHADEHMPDREKVAQVLLATGQLLAYLEAETGVTPCASGGSHIQTAPQFIVQNVGEATAQTLLTDAIRTIFTDKPSEDGI